MAVEARQVGPIVGVDQLLQRVGVLRGFVRDEVHRGRQHAPTHRPGRGVHQETGDRAGHGHAGVVGVSGIDVTAIRSDRPGEGGLQGRDLLAAKAALGLGATALQDGRIEVATADVKHHAVLQAVALVADLQETVDEQLAVGGGKGAAGDDLAGLGIHRRDAVEGHRRPFQRQVGPVGAHGRCAGDDAVE